MIKYLIAKLLAPFKFIIEAIKVTKQKRAFHLRRRIAWALFMSKENNKKFVYDWYREKRSKPPVYYDSKRGVYVLLNRRERRKLISKQKRGG